MSGINKIKEKYYSVDEIKPEKGSNSLALSCMKQSVGLLTKNCSRQQQFQTLYEHKRIQFILCYNSSIPVSHAKHLGLSVPLYHSCGRRYV